MLQNCPVGRLFSVLSETGTSTAEALTVLWKTPRVYVETLLGAKQSCGKSPGFIAHWQAYLLLPLTLPLVMPRPFGLPLALPFCRFARFASCLCFLFLSLSFLIGEGTKCGCPYPGGLRKRVSNPAYMKNSPTLRLYSYSAAGWPAHVLMVWLTNASNHAIPIRIFRRHLTPRKHPQGLTICPRL